MFDQLNVIEIFSSVHQGEGPYVGYRQVFLRLAGCNLSCSYCDTAFSREKPPAAVVEQTPGKRYFVELPNQLKLDMLKQHLNKLLLQVHHHSLSVTGGEPLLHTKLLPQLFSEIAVPVYLETNGTLPEQLAILLPYIEIVSMDIKLPSACGLDLWEEHKQFMKIAAAKRLFVKVVVTNQTTPQEFAEVVRIVAGIDPRIPLIIQPVKPPLSEAKVMPLVILAYQEQALTKLSDVRVKGHSTNSQDYGSTISISKGGRTVENISYK